MSRKLFMMGAVDVLSDLCDGAMMTWWVRFDAYGKCVEVGALNDIGNGITHRNEHMTGLDEITVSREPAAFGGLVARWVHQELLEVLQ